MQKVRVTALLAFVAAAFLAGCSTGPTTAQRENLVNPDRGVNFLGIVRHSQNSFEAPSKTALNLSSRELVWGSDMSGDSLSLLWGSIHLRDY